MNQAHGIFDVETAPVKFLIVDDAEVSIMAIKRAPRTLKILNPVLVAKDGQAALDILRGDRGADKLMPPYLVILDLNMPRMDGLEFLDDVRADPELQTAAIFVLSTSDAPDDVAAAYGNNIAGYIVKDALGDSIERALSMIDTFSKVVELPR